MTKRNNYVGPCATACKPGAGTDTQNGTFDRILVAATEHARREVGLPGRADRMIACRSCIRCGCAFDAPGPRRFADDDFCLLCLEEIARADERAAALGERCRVHRVRRVEDLPVSVLEEMQVEWGRC